MLTGVDSQEAVCTYILTGVDSQEAMCTYMLTDMDSHMHVGIKNPCGHTYIDVDLLELM